MKVKVQQQTEIVYSYFNITLFSKSSVEGTKLNVNLLKSFFLFLPFQSGDRNVNQPYLHIC